jgi:hypothetical protein
MAELGLLTITGDATLLDWRDAAIAARCRVIPGPALPLSESWDPPQLSLFAVPDVDPVMLGETGRHRRRLAFQRPPRRRDGQRQGHRGAVALTGAEGRRGEQALQQALTHVELPGQDTFDRASQVFDRFLLRDVPACATPQGTLGAQTLIVPRQHQQREVRRGTAKPVGLLDLRGSGLREECAAAGTSLEARPRDCRFLTCGGARAGTDSWAAQVGPGSAGAGSVHAR